MFPQRQTDGTLLAYLHGQYTGSARPLEILVHISFEPFASMKQRLRDPGGPENAKINTHCLYVSATVYGSLKRCNAIYIMQANSLYCDLCTTIRYERENP